MGGSSRQRHGPPAAHEDDHGSLRPLLDQARPRRHDGKPRRYLIHQPAGQGDDAPLPVVMVLHGAGGTAAWTLGETGWAAKADHEGFLLVLPEGLRSDLAKPPHFL